MNNVTLEISGDAWDIKEELIHFAAAGNLAAAQEFVAHESHLLLEVAPQGRYYPSGRRDGSIHRASAPGQPPHEDTGKLRESIEIDASNNTGLMPYTEVGWTGEQAMIAKVLNDGNSSGTLMPRPHFDESAEAGVERRDQVIRDGL